MKNEKMFCLGEKYEKKNKRKFNIKEQKNERGIFLFLECSIEQVSKLENFKWKGKTWKCESLLWEKCDNQYIYSTIYYSTGQIWGNENVLMSE